MTRTNEQKCKMKIQPGCLTKFLWRGKVPLCARERCRWEVELQPSAVSDRNKLLESRQLDPKTFRGLSSLYTLAPSVVTSQWRVRCVSTDVTWRRWRRREETWRVFRWNDDVITIFVSTFRVSSLDWVNTDLCRGITCKSPEQASPLSLTPKLKVNVKKSETAKRSTDASTWYSNSAQTGWQTCDVTYVVVTSRVWKVSLSVLLASTWTSVAPNSGPTSTSAGSWT